MAIAGGCLIAAAIYQTYAAVRGTFAQHNKLSEMSPGARAVPSNWGPRSRALVLGLIGSFLIRTATDVRPSTGIVSMVRYLKCTGNRLATGCWPWLLRGCWRLRSSPASKRAISASESPGAFACAHESRNLPG